MVLGTGTTWLWVWVWVRVRTHGYGYGYKPMGTGTGTRPWVRVWVRVRHVSESWVWVWVRVQDHRYGYGYGYAISYPGTGTGTGMGTGTGTTSLNNIPYIRDHRHAVKLYRRQKKRPGNHDNSPSYQTSGPGGGHSLKICDGYVRPHWPPFSNRLSLNDPLFIFHILLSPNDPHFQNALSLNDPPFLEIFIGENGRHALTEWRPFSPMNDHLIICTQYLFGRRDLCSC